MPAAWTPDGTKVLAVRRDASREARILTVSADDGQVTVLKSLGWRWPVSLSLSPDGKWIAYDLPIRDDSPGKDIFLLAADGPANFQAPWRSWQHSSAENAEDKSLLRYSSARK